MCKKVTILTCVLFLLVSLAGNVSGATWTNADPCDSLWRTAANWSPASVPGGGVSVSINIVPGPTIDSLTAAVCTNMLFGTSGASTLDITGGSLNNGGYLSLAHNPGYSATMNVSGGATVSNIGTLYIGNHGNGTLHVSGSSTVVDAVGLLTLCGSSNSEYSRTYLHSGTLSCENLTGSALGNEILVDIYEGTFIVRNKIGASMQSWIDDGYIKAYGGTGTVILTVDGNGYDVLTAIPEPATLILLGLGSLALIRRKHA